MRNKNMVKFAKIMIVFSVFLMLTGLFFFIRDEYKILDPIKDTKVVVSDDKENVTITTIDGTDVDDSDSSDSNSAVDSNSNNITDDNSSTNNNNSSSNSNNNNNSGNSSNNSNNNASSGSSNNNSNSNSSTNTTPSVPSVTPSIDEVNASLRNSIQSKYGITVKYGSETNGYSVGGLATVTLSDSSVINTSLNNLSSVMSLYPTNFFKEMNNSGLNLTIYLIKKYSSNNVTGVTDSSTNNVLISIATDYSIAESLNHEIFHYIDYYIEKNNGKYTSWNNLNPSGFSYGNIDSNFSYNRTFSEDAFFVNNYAQTDEYEDRASTFEYMMADTKASCLNYGKNVWLKAKYIAEQVDYFYSSVSPSVTEYWERFIY